MSVDHQNEVLPAAPANAGTVSRRGAIGRMAAVTVAATVATPALAAITGTSNANVRTFKGQYALPGGSIVDGMFVWPKTASNMDVIVVIPGRNGHDAALEKIVVDQAASGRMVIAPDLNATFGNKGGMSYDAMVADIVSRQQHFRRMNRSTGNMRFVSAA